MKSYTEQWLAALKKGDAMSHGAAKLVLPDGNLCVWGGYGILTLPDDNGDPEEYIGVGDRGLISVTSGQLGGAAEPIKLTLSGVDPNTQFPLIKARGAPALIWRLGFNSTGRTLLDATRFDRGRVSQAPREETVGGLSNITVMVEGAAISQGRFLNRMRSDADQRLVKGDDDGLKQIAVAPNKKLYWGGELPKRVSDAMGQISLPFGIKITPKGSK